ncbi:hypothetical protein C2845_PM13G08170 [Panicum miliaceum]|uniref:Uncharacterized protein n=1 Tax=Panicum miliaceum TaxID=4540 RepID=A0A3L6RH47_PANMI|nr:hypothetical protein C2845_PM13G08170 [Panicum miliaceum]
MGRSGGRAELAGLRLEAGGPTRAGGGILRPTTRRGRAVAPVRRTLPRELDARPADRVGADGRLQAPSGWVYGQIVNRISRAASQQQGNLDSIFPNPAMQSPFSLLKLNKLTCEIIYAPFCGLKLLDEDN